MVKKNNTDSHDLKLNTVNNKQNVWVNNEKWKFMLFLSNNKMTSTISKYNSATALVSMVSLEQISRL